MPPPPRIPKDTRPNPPAYSIPTLSIRVDSLSHPGAVVFFNAVHPTTVLREAVISSFTWLYTPKTVPTHVEAILLVLRPMEGIAYTSGSHTHKEIHFSLDYIYNFVGKSSSGSSDDVTLKLTSDSNHAQRTTDEQEKNTRAKNEIYGIIVHEVVHCFQYDAKGTCPGGLIEGIADYVRLNAGYVPSHWRHTPGDKWDAGYEKTAYFLDWIETRSGPGAVRRLNASVKDTYDVGIFEDVTGSSVKELWDLYCKGFETSKM